MSKESIPFESSSISRYVFCLSFKGCIRVHLWLGFRYEFSQFGQNCFHSFVRYEYLFTVLSKLILVKQVNLMLGIPNEIYVPCFPALAEAIAQFKVLPFSVFLSSLCPPGCEGSHV
jgi:hypothetical protein